RPRRRSGHRGADERRLRGQLRRPDGAPRHAQQLRERRVGREYRQRLWGCSRGQREKSSAVKGASTANAPTSNAQPTSKSQFPTPVWNWQLEVGAGCWELAVGWELSVGRWALGVGWELAVGRGALGVGSWELAVGWALGVGLIGSWKL